MAGSARPAASHLCCDRYGSTSWLSGVVLEKAVRFSRGVPCEDDNDDERERRSGLAPALVPLNDVVREHRPGLTPALKPVLDWRFRSM